MVKNRTTRKGERRPALDEASEPADSGYRGAVTHLVARVLDIGIDGRGPLDSAGEVAAAALERRRGDIEAAVQEVINAHTRLAAAGGFLTSMGGFITLPVSLPVNVLEFYALSTRMTAAVAALRGYDLNAPHIRSAVLLTLVGAEADDLLAQVGVVTPTGRLSSMAAERLPGPALMVLNKAIGFRLLTTAGRSTLGRFGKAVPVLGGAVGAGLDTYLIRRIADQAKREFPLAGQALAMGRGPALPRQ
ncbi:MAG: hypothetical protein ACK5MP_08295 [Nostocoides sp.]